MIIQITGVTSGTSPYDVFLCDTGYTSCFLISGSCQIPPTVIIETNNFFPNYDSIGVKLIDSNGCIYTENKVCSTPTPTPSPTPSPTSTPSPTPSPTSTPTPTPSPTSTPTPTPSPTSTPTPTPTSPDYIVIASDFDLDDNYYLYNPTNNTSEGPYIPSGWTQGGAIANTSSKLWLRPLDGGIDEWDITLNPFTLSYNKSIVNPFSDLNRQGLEVKNPTTLIATHVTTATSLNHIYEIDVSTSAATYTLITSLQGSLSGESIIRDIALSTTNDLIVLGTKDFTSYHIQQYVYSASSILDIEIDITSGITSPTGIIGDGGGIYIMDSNAKLYSIELTPPYSISTVFDPTIDAFLYTSQSPGSLTVSFS